jgi:hypothetical protein
MSFPFPMEMPLRLSRDRLANKPRLAGISMVAAANAWHDGNSGMDQSCPALTEILPPTRPWSREMRGERPGMTKALAQTSPGG